MQPYFRRCKYTYSRHLSIPVRICSRCLATRVQLALSQWQDARRAPTSSAAIRNTALRSLSGAHLQSGDSGSRSNPRCKDSCSSPSPRGRWHMFCDSWNEKLTQHPIPMVIFFRGIGTLTWAPIFCVLSMSTSARSLLAAPEYAVAWLVVSTTFKLRQPLNAILAATLSRMVPAVSKLKVSPLLAFFATDRRTREAIDEVRKSIETSAQLSKWTQDMLKGSFRSGASAIRWVEGPIDKYGFAYFLAGKATSISLLGGATVAMTYGLDVPGVLSQLGLSGDLQDEAGLLACCSVLNVALTPIHFCGTVNGIQYLEQRASDVWQEEQREEREKTKVAFDDKSGSNAPTESTIDGITGAPPSCLFPISSEEQYVKMASSPSSQNQTDGGDIKDAEEEFTEEKCQQNIVWNVAWCALLLDLGFVMYIARRLTKAQVSPQKQNTPPSTNQEGM